MLPGLSLLRKAEHDGTACCGAKITLLIVTFAD